MSNDFSQTDIRMSKKKTPRRIGTAEGNRKKQKKKYKSD